MDGSSDSWTLLPPSLDWWLRGLRILWTIGSDAAVLFSWLDFSVSFLCLVRLSRGPGGNCWFVDWSKVLEWVSRLRRFRSWWVNSMCMRGNRLTLSTDVWDCSGYHSRWSCHVLSTVSPSRRTSDWREADFQRCVAFGILLGFSSNLVFMDIGPLAWRFQICASFVPAVPVVCLIWFCPGQSATCLRRFIYANQNEQNPPDGSSKSIASNNRISLSAVFEIPRSRPLVISSMHTTSSSSSKKSSEEPHSSDVSRSCSPFHVSAALPLVVPLSWWLSSFLAS